MVADRITIVLAWVALLTVVGIPLFAYLLNRIPAILTLRPRSKRWESSTGEDGVTIMRETNHPQRPVWQRGVYLVLVGWWASAIWMSLAYLLCLIVIGLPIGLYMFNRTGAIATLLRY